MSQLVESSRDKIEMTKAVAKQWRKVTALMIRRKGLLIIPPAIEQSAKIATRIGNRYNKGDFRHTQKEMQEEYKVAVWLVETWAELNGNPCPPIKFRPKN